MKINDQTNQYFDSEEIKNINAKQTNKNKNNKKNNKKKSSKNIDKLDKKSQNERNKASRTSDNSYFTSIEFFSSLSETEFLNSIQLLAKNQIGCRFIQKKIDEYPDLGNNLIFPKLLKSNLLFKLTMDAFGNYLIQKLVEILNENNLDKLISNLSLNFYEVGTSSHGTRVIQKISEIVKSPTLVKKFSINLYKFVSDFMKDPNANHIIQNYIQKVQYPENQFIYDQICLNFLEFSTNKHACSALQKCIDYSNNFQKQKIAEKIIENAYLLMIDPYGNYIMQHYIMFNDYTTNSKIAKLFINNIAYLSKQKFSSNVIEKCFDHCDDETRFFLIKSLCHEKIIVDLLLDMYGNYSIYKLF